MISGLKVNAKINGLEELVKSLTSSGLFEVFAPELTTSLLEINSALIDSVKARYAVGKGGGVSQALQDRPTITNTASLVRGELTYYSPYRNLAWFVTETEMGNIPPLPKQHEGEIVKVTIRRGQNKIAFGRYGRGAFFPNGKGKTYLVERTSDDRYPIKSVYGPSTSQMISWVWGNDLDFQSKKEKIIDNMAKRVIKRLNARAN